MFGFRAKVLLGIGSYNFKSVPLLAQIIVLANLLLKAGAKD